MEGPHQSEGMKYKITPITAVGDKLDKIRWMDKVCFPDEESCSFDGAYWWFAYNENNNLVGYAALTYFPDNLAFLSRVGVLPGYRGGGLQCKFIRRREREARKNGVTRLVTYTAPAGVVSSNNMIKCGYRLYTPEVWWGLRHGLYWEKKL